jgi:hypothetical protein
MKTTDLPPSACPYCDYLTDGASDPTGKYTPKPGDFSICLACAQLLVFDSGLKLRKPSPAEEKTAKQLESVQRFQRAVRSLDRATVGNK